MDTTHQFVARQDDQASGQNVSESVTTKLLIVLLVLALVISACVGALWYLRIRRKNQNALLPVHEDGKLTPKRSNHRRLSGVTISSSIPFSRRASQSGLVENEKQDLARSSPSPPPGNLPQIRITLPEEVDNDGKRQSGRVVVVNIGENGNVGVEDEKLPPYPANERFVSIDLERVGGLHEKQPLPQGPRP